MAGMTGNPDKEFSKLLDLLKSGKASIIEETGDWDSVDGGFIDPNIAQKRVNSGWYGDQDENALRLDKSKVLEVLKNKIRCTEAELEGHGVYQFTEKKSGLSYIGKAKAQSLHDRIMQHVSKATSDSNLTGNFDPLLRENPHINNWEVTIYPRKAYYVDQLEASLIEREKPELNIQKPNIPW